MLHGLFVIADFLDKNLLMRNRIQFDIPFCAIFRVKRAILASILLSKPYVSIRNAGAGGSPARASPLRDRRLPQQKPPNTLTHIHAPSLSLSLTHTHAPPLSIIHRHTLPLSHSLSHTHKHALSVALSLSPSYLLGRSLELLDAGALHPQLFLQHLLPHSK